MAAIKTPDDLARRQRELKGQFLRRLGDLPEKTPLDARVVGVEARDGYRLERVIYESRPGHHVTALFYLPDGPPPFPAVLMPCGHDDNGKAAEAYQRGCILLARNGIAASATTRSARGSGGSSSTETASRPARGTRRSTRSSASVPCWSAGAPPAIASGTASAASTTWRAGPRSTCAAWAARDAPGEGP